jgi:hypothetical protein
MKKTQFVFRNVMDRINRIAMIFFFCPSRTEGQNQHAAKGGKQEVRVQTRD